MSKIIASILCSAFIAASTMASASAEPHKGHKAERTTTKSNEQFRRSNAYVVPRIVDAPTLGGSQSNGVMSAPAGR